MVVVVLILHLHKFNRVANAHHAKWVSSVLTWSLHTTLGFMQPNVVVSYLNII